MADTERSINDLLTTLFQDGQAAGAITPQDVRDMIVSIAPSYGGMHISSSAATTIAAVDTPTKASGTTTISGTVRHISMPANNRLRNDGTATRMFLIEASFSMTTASNNIIVGIGIAKNGTYNANSEIRRKVGTGTDIGAGAISFHVSLAQNDYVEVFVTNRTDGTNITLDYLSVNVIGFLE